MDLDREDMIEAVTAGVREGIVALGTSHGQFDIPHELLFDAVRKGVADGIWRIASNGTQMPGSDFYDTIKEGVENAIARFRPDDT